MLPNAGDELDAYAVAPPKTPLPKPPAEAPDEEALKGAAVPKPKADELWAPPDADPKPNPEPNAPAGLGCAPKGNHMGNKMEPRVIVNACFTVVNLPRVRNLAPTTGMGKVVGDLLYWRLTVQSREIIRLTKLSYPNRQARRAYHHLDY